MKEFYDQLKQAEQTQDARLSQLAKVCKAELSDVQAKNLLDPWTWWTEE